MKCQPIYLNKCIKFNINKLTAAPVDPVVPCGPGDPGGPYNISPDKYIFEHKIVNIFCTKF